MDDICITRRLELEAIESHIGLALATEPRMARRGYQKVKGEISFPRIYHEHQIPPIIPWRCTTS
jgi:hypothetical protein